MAKKLNPLNLNGLQLRTLTLLQELARYPEIALTDDATGNVTISSLPQPHGNHFHVGRRVVMSSDATGLHNPSVYIALARKGLVVPNGMIDTPTLTAAGVAYDTGLRDVILHGSDH
ncbi:hypothetical protein [Reyranella sp. CPCC 100927]|uniref:hypothetical protein n=1 Tax=Reyranella sp. CPCC 100927 TaxID=2599616 RepID=UPI0011B74085|nr:hypothetical protein [Reyranella sp. CPCC 100927]TWT03978.1 hypothetical protein FQU96_26670 [Reyranella sp. CPCC 100927]